jgi:hypothetical protein
MMVANWHVRHGWPVFFHDSFIWQNGHIVVKVDSLLSDIRKEHVLQNVRTWKV